MLNIVWASLFVRLCGEVCPELLHNNVDPESGMVYWSMLLPVHEMDGFPVAAKKAHVTIMYGVRFEAQSFHV